MTDEEFTKELKNLVNTVEQMFTLCCYQRATNGRGSVEDHAVDYIQALAIRLRYLLGVRDGTIEVESEDEQS